MFHPEDGLFFFETSGSTYLTTGNPVRASCPGTVPVLWGLMSCVPVPVFLKIPFSTPDDPDLCKS